MDYFQAIFLGIIQGIAEWLPISSEGQAVLTGIKILGLSPDVALSYAIFLHLGTLFVVLIRFRKTWYSLLTGMDIPLLKRIILVTAGTGITAVPIFLVLEEFFNADINVTLLIGLLLIVTGIMLKYSKKGVRDIESLSPFELFGLGLIQGFAILPGISRSGVTITALLMRNIRPESALIFSFLISVPPVIGAIILSDIPPESNISLNLTMILSAFIVGGIMMEVLLRISHRLNFSFFCLFLGGITVILSLL
ncbi:MAG: undecaprenyl-diphosphate phosphatase [Methanomicrobiales archaeon]|nr:undecaprenyl-diphosphate phosphatase [Methanomicrobiales archaeon]